MYAAILQKNSTRMAAYIDFKALCHSSKQRNTFFLHKRSHLSTLVFLENSFAAANACTPPNNAHTHTIINLHQLHIYQTVYVHAIYTQHSCKRQPRAKRKTAIEHVKQVSGVNAKWKRRGRQEKRVAFVVEKNSTTKKSSISLASSAPLCLKKQPTLGGRFPLVSFFFSSLSPSYLCRREKLILIMRYSVSL